jgi:hypothetical protein
MAFYFFHTGQVLSSTGLVCAKFKCISTTLQQHALSWGSPVNHGGMVSVSCFYVGWSRQMSIVKFNRFSFPLWIGYCNLKKSCYHTFNVQLSCILRQMNIDITTSIMVPLWLHIWVWLGIDGSFEISNSKGIWVRNHQHKAIRWQLKEVWSSSNGNLNRFGRCWACGDWNFRPFWLLSSTWESKLLITFGCWLYNHLVGVTTIFWLPLVFRIDNQIFFSCLRLPIV